MSKRVLLTGVGGFIGSHCLKYFIENTDWEIVGIDSFRHKGTPQRLIDIAGEETLANDRVAIHKHDLSVPINHQLENLLLERTLAGWQKPIDIIINMASESAVERSIDDPVACLKNNFDLTLNMLEFARRVKPERFFQVSTDECFGEAKTRPHEEWDVLLPSNAYAASKACQEMLAIGYWRTYDVPVIITSTMNNIGEGQDPEKFLPTIIQKVATFQDVPIYGDDVNNIGSRYYLHAVNHADAFVFLSQQPISMYKAGADRPDKYNVSGDQELTNLELAEMVAEIIGKDLSWKLVLSESARPGYDRRYALDGSKMKALGWQPPLSLRESLEKTVKWYLANPHWIL
jgi:dTDP-glucose 4,6-dehydratase